MSPDNNAKSLPAIMGVYLLLDGQTGEPCALIDGQRITLWRTACASALAADYLAREDASSMLMVGAGALAPFLVRAHASVRPRQARGGLEPHLRQCREAGADSSGGRVRRRGWRKTSTMNSAMPTSSPARPFPRFRSSTAPGLKPGTHVDLVGAFAPTMRESDDEAVRRARVFVDTYGGATKGSGRHRAGARQRCGLPATGSRPTSTKLCRGEKKGRESDDEITLFKSVGGRRSRIWPPASSVWESIGS